MTGAKIVDRDYGYRKAIEGLRNFGHDITVGVHEDVGRGPYEDPDPDAEGGVTLVDVAIANEFGIPEGSSPGKGHPPERSFVRSWADERGQKMMDIVRAYGEEVASGKGLTYTRAAKQIAAWAEGDMKRRVMRGEIVQQLSDQTIEARKKPSRTKASATPYALADTLQLVGGIEGRAKKVG